MNSFALAAIVFLAMVGPVAAQPQGGDWNAFNRSELESLIATLGKGSPNYDPARPPYAVFDWDNTSVFLDVEEATLVYQLDTLGFAATPALLDQALRTKIPNDSAILALIDDVVESYSWLYLRLRAGASAKELSGKPHHLNFRAKFLRLYQVLEEKHGPEVAYPWMPYRFSGMTAEQVRSVTREAVAWQLRQPIGSIEWESPKKLAGKAGVTSATWRNGLRLYPEMQGLYRSLRKAGFDVWICTASFAEGIGEVSSSLQFGYGNPASRVIGLQLETDDQGRFRPVNKAEITYAQGKTQAIERLLVAKYGAGPALVAGDSDGDVSMLTAFADTKVSLILEIQQRPDSPIGELVNRARLQRGKPGSRYLVQKRDEKTGRLLP
jgi:phosphoserine phosphatase